MPSKGGPVYQHSSHIPFNSIISGHAEAVIDVAVIRKHYISLKASELKACMPSLTIKKPQKATSCIMPRSPEAVMVSED